MIYVLLAAYNEQQRLASVLEALPRTVSGHPVTPILVSDGSTDDTAAIARSYGCITIESPVNRGKGASLKLAFEHLKQVQRGEAIVLMDADGQHDPADIPRIVAPVLGGGASMSVGSRYLDSTGRGSTPWNRYAVRTITVWTLRHGLSMKVTDPFSGFRSLSPSALDCVSLKGDRYQSELEMLFCTTQRGLHVVEVPIQRVYGSGMSKMGATGKIRGRVAVVSSYASTVARELARGSRNVARQERTSLPV